MDPKQLLGNIDTNGLVGKMIGGMATKNFAAGLVGGMLLGGGKKDMVEDIAKVGGLALLGTLAYKAYGNYQQTKQAGGNATIGGAVSQSASGMLAQAKGLIASASGGAAAPAALPAPAQTPALGLAIVRVMIAAAKADGKMDDAEMKKIMGQMDAGGLTADERLLLMRELAAEPDVTAIASAATTPEQAAEIYLAALLVCDSQCVAEQFFLSALAAALKLEPAFTQNLQQELLTMQANKAA